MSERERAQKKAYRVMMVIIGGLGIIFLLGSTIDRFCAAYESKDYILTTGTVSHVSERKETTTGRYRRTYKKYQLAVKYQPRDSITEESLTTDYVFYSPRKLGEKMHVMYHKKQAGKDYIAKKDWLTGKYISLTKKYDMWLGISIAFVAIAVALYGYSLQWENKIKAYVIAGVGILFIIIGMVICNKNKL